MVTKEPIVLSKQKQRIQDFDQSFNVGKTNHFVYSMNLGLVVILGVLGWVYENIGWFIGCAMDGGEGKIRGTCLVGWYLRLDVIEVVEGLGCVNYEGLFGDH